MSVRALPDRTINYTWHVILPLDILFISPKNQKLKRTGVSESDLSCECLETLSELADVGNILGLSHPTLENYLVSHY